MTSGVCLDYNDHGIYTKISIISCPKLASFQQYESMCDICLLIYENHKTTLSYSNDGIQDNGFRASAACVLPPPAPFMANLVQYSFSPTSTVLVIYGCHCCNRAHKEYAHLHLPPSFPHSL